MRKLLAAAVAIAPLMVATGAQAEIVISTTRTTPITTGNATGSGPDNIRLASGGVVNVSGGAAVTLDSSHSVDIDSGGGVTIVNGSAGSTGILANGGNTGNITIGGAITLTDNVTDTDTDSDGDFDGAFASGTDRYGVRVIGAAPLTGNILIETSGAILVEGNNSFGISVETALIGNLINLGSIQTNGDNSIALRTTGSVTGNVALGGSIRATGLNATAASFQGDINGRLVLQSDISSTGYRYTSRGNDTFVANLEAEDRLQNQSPVIIGGNVTGGVLLDRAGNNIDTTNADEDADGIPDISETNSIINSYGAAPAVTVGSATRSVTLGVVGTGTSAFGFINRGEITSQGIYDGIQANGLQFGVAGGQTVTIDGGFRNEGTIAVLAREAGATGLHFLAGASSAQLVNTGTMTTAAATTSASAITGLLIEAGANTPSFTNSGSFLTTAGGGTATVVGVRDLSGTLTSITNTRSFQATLNPNANGDAPTGSTTAFDLSANTTGVTILQTGVVGTATATDPDTDGDGVLDSAEPIIIGDIRLGSGADLVDVRNGVLFGSIAFGAGADRLSITGGALVDGALSDSDGQLAIDVIDGQLIARQTAPVDISRLNIGSAGDLIFNIDPANNTNSGFRVSGTATLANGAGLGVRFASLINAPQRFTVIDATTLNYGAIDLAGVQDNSPYLFVVGASANIAAGDVYIDVRRRTAAEASLISVEASAFDSIYGALSTDADIRNAFLAQTSREGFIDLYEQLLPDHSGGPLLSLASGVDAVTRALTGRNASAAPGETSAWVQEINFYADKDRTDTYGFRSEGFGVAGGVEHGSGLGAVGVTVAFTSSDLEDPESAAEEVLTANLVELGLYWRAQGQYWTTWARAAGGYASFNSTRKLVGAGLNLTNEASWNGFSLAAAGGFSYERNFGRFSIRPEVYAEYFGLHEDARTETGGGAAFDLDIDERDGHMFSATAAINVGMGMGDNSWLRPELRLGWRQNISVDPGETIARFSGGSDFNLSPLDIEGGGPILGFRLNIGNELGMLSINADAEMIEDYVRYMLLLRASFRF